MVEFEKDVKAKMREAGVDEEGDEGGAVGGGSGGGS